jgi:hypothetical protein
MLTPKLLHPKATYEMLGYIPDFLSELDPDRAVAQLDKSYKHGGGWVPFQGFTFDPVSKSIKYPGDPAYPAIAEFTLRDEKIYMYPHAWVLVLQTDGSYVVARMD